MVYLVFQEMKKEDSPLFEPGLNKALKEKDEEEPNEPPKKRTRKNPPKKPGVVPNPNHKGKEEEPGPDSEASDEGEE